MTRRLAATFLWIAIASAMAASLFLVKHVVKERHTGAKGSLARAVQIEGDLDLGFEGVAGYGGSTWGH